MRRRIERLPRETLPERHEVFHLQGLPPRAEPRRHVAAILEEATAAYLETAEPRALVADISQAAFAGVYRGEGGNAPVTPVEAVVSRADTIALFVATVGSRVTDRIRTLFATNEPALAAMLDSVASAAADRFAAMLGHWFVAEAGGASADGRRALAYSPGYCGWHVTGQRALFEYLEPGDIGVTLNASCLMDPLKSVSGVLAAGCHDIHRFLPAFPFCADCRDKPCLGRIRSLSVPDAAGTTSPKLEGA